MAEQSLITDVSLVGYHDDGFIQWARRMMKSTGVVKGRDSYAADYQKKLGALEECIRQVLAARVFLMEERVLRFNSTGRRGYRRLEYREVDAVVGANGLPCCAVEMKFREQVLQPFKGFAQLKRTLGVMRSVWPGVNGLFLTLWMSPVFGCAGDPPEILSSWSDVIGFLTRPPQSAAAGLCVDAREFLQVAASAGFWSPDETVALLELRRAAAEPLSTLNTPSSNGQLNCLGRLLENITAKESEPG